MGCKVHQQECHCQHFWLGLEWGGAEDPVTCHVALCFDVVIVGGAPQCNAQYWHPPVLCSVSELSIGKSLNYPLLRKVRWRLLRALTQVAAAALVDGARISYVGRYNLPTLCCWKLPPSWAFKQIPSQSRDPVKHLAYFSDMWVNRLYESASPFVRIQAEGDLMPCLASLPDLLYGKKPTVLFKDHEHILSSLWEHFSHNDRNKNTSLSKKSQKKCL